MDISLNYHLVYIICLGIHKNNWARESTNVGRWFSRRDRNITGNISLAHNTPFSNSFWSVSIYVWKKYLITFFIGNLVSYIFWFNFFSLSRLGTKLGNPVFRSEMRIRMEKHRSNFSQFRICFLGSGDLQFDEKNFHP